MRKLRIIPRLDIKGENLIKGIHLEGLRVLGNPSEFANTYYITGADELLYMDTVASLYERNNILSIVEQTAKEIFIPLTVGGGVRSIIDAQQALRSGADKIAINTAAIKEPQLIKELSESFGSQCVVASVEAKKIAQDDWEAYIDNGREKTGISVLKWVDQVQKMGAGEILITSVDQEGTQSGFDIPLIKRVCEISTIPVIASGGMGTLRHLLDLVEHTRVDAIAIAHTLHYKLLSLPDIHSALAGIGVEVRQ